VKHFDLQDLLLAAGLCSIFGGIYSIYRPAAFIAAGAALISFALLIQFARNRRKDSK
jgi:hypothetical protein